MSEAVALGLRTHSGWAVAVAVAGSPIKPIIVERQRIKTADERIAGSKQPYHAAKQLPPEEAEALIRRCQESSTLLAIQSLNAAATRLGQKGVTLVGTAILLASGRPLPSLPAILRSHALIHTAEGELFREVLVTASSNCSLEVMRVIERDVWQTAATLFGLQIADLKRRIDDLGKSVGPPWQQDEKLASLAAWITLFKSR
jgi:hypothetical protein